MSFIIGNCDVLARQLSQTKSEETAKDEEASKNVPRKRANLTPDEAAIHRSLSISSQKEKNEDEYISSTTVKDLLGLYSKKFESGVINPTLFIEISKLIITKNTSPESMKSIIDLYRRHNLETKSLLTNDLLQVIQDHVKSVKTRKTTEETNPTLKTFCSYLL